MSFISDIEAGIQSLFHATDNGFMVDPSRGQNHLNHWVDQLRSSDHPSVRPIITELGVLQGHLDRNNAAGMAASFQLLGELTAKSALQIHNFSGEGDKLRELSQKLITAGGNLRQIALTQAPVQH
jgi:hypothetical protein